MLLQCHQVLDGVQQALPDVRVTRMRNLAWGILGILRVRDGHLTVSEMARAIGNRSKHWPQVHADVALRKPCEVGPSTVLWRHLALCAAALPCGLCWCSTAAMHASL